jgi:hypothetical protein
MSRSSAHASGSAVVVLAFIDRLSFTYSGSSYDFSYTFFCILSFQNDQLKTVGDNQTKAEDGLSQLQRLLDAFFTNISSVIKILFIKI